MTTPADPALLPLRRGMVLRRFNPGGSDEVGVVLRRLSDDSVECAHGWVDDRPDVGLFTVSFEHLRRGLWRVATDEDAAKVRTLFLAHAQDYGPDSAAWAVAEEAPSTWETPPVALPWDPATAGNRAAARLRSLEAAELAYLLDAQWTTRRGRWFPPEGSPLSLVQPTGWTVGCAVANQRNLDEPDPEPEPPPPTPEHAAKVREQVRQIVSRPKRKADRRVGR